MIPYTTLYNLIETYIFGTVQTGSWQELITMLCATAGSLFVLAVPFIILARVIKVIWGR